MQDNARGHRLRRSLLSGEPIDTEDRAWLTALVDEHLAVFRNQPDLPARDDLLRQTASKFWPNRNVSEQARFLRAALLRYKASGWQHEQWDLASPAARAGSIEECCWHILQASTLVSSERHLRRILAMATGNGQDGDTV